MKNQLNFEDYKACMYTLRLQGKTDRNGKPLVSVENIKYAKIVVRLWLRNIHRLAKKMVGDYICRLKLAWKIAMRTESRYLIEPKHISIFLQKFALAFVVVFLLLIAQCNKAIAQANKPIQVHANENGDIVLPKSEKKPLEAKFTGKMILNENGTRDSLFQGAKGGYFVFRVSKKTSKKYKKYLQIKLD